MKLKTLKDLKSIATPMNNLVSKQELKEEAIKWVKNYRRLRKEANDLGAEISYKAKEDVLMEFHNITEEDLK